MEMWKSCTMLKYMGIAGGVCVVALEAVSFKVCLVDYVEAQLITQLHKIGRRRVMRGPDAVDIQLFHEGEILKNLITGLGITVFPMCIVMIDAMKLDRCAVDQKLAPRGDRLSSESDLDGYVLACRLYNCGI